LVSSALFICVGVLYDRYKSRIVKYYGGLVQLMPLLSFFFFFFTISNMSFPGTSSFIGELLILLSCFFVNIEVSFIAAFGMILNGVYVIWLFNRVFFGPINESSSYFAYSDLNKREFAILFLFVFFILFFGFYPNSILDNISYSSFFLIFQTLI
jgi:NADH:ubiquinone oxidoreductase subunit 4 (subunit M)